VHDKIVNRLYGATGLALQHASRAVATGNNPAKLMEVWSQRVSEVLPDGEFEVELYKGALRVRGVGPRSGAGRISVFPPVLQLPLPASQRLKLFFVDECDALQRFVTNARGEPWPGPHANLHVQVDSKAVNIWWSNNDDKITILKMRPLLRKEIDM